MKKYYFKTSWLLQIIILLTLSGTVFARPHAEVTVKSGEIIPHDQFICTQIYRNDGTIKGDLFIWAQNISSAGTVEGDIIGGGHNVNLSGNILGNIRTAGASVNLSGKVRKNVNVLAAYITLSGNSAVGGSLIARGHNIDINGSVKGNTLLYGRKIILNGEFFGDVAINYSENNKNNGKNNHSEISLTVLPGTIIHGKLKFKGDVADLQKGAKIVDFQWIKSGIPSNEKIADEIKSQIRDFVKMLLTSAVYFLIGLLFFKLFPAAFGRIEEFSSQKPWNSIAYGLLVLLSIIAAAVICIVLLIMSFFITPAFGLTFGVLASGIYLLLFYFSILPVALLLGKLIAKEKGNMVSRLAIGLVLFNLVIFFLGLLSNVPVIGSVFPALTFIIKFGAVLFGTGALIYAAKGFFTKAKIV